MEFKKREFTITVCTRAATIEYSIGGGNIEVSVWTLHVLPVFACVSSGHLLACLFEQRYLTTDW